MTTSLVAGLIYAITCTTGFFQNAGQPAQEMCVVSINGGSAAFYEGSCKEVGESLYKDALHDGKSPTLVVNGFQYNKV